MVGKIVRIALAATIAMGVSAAVPAMAKPGDVIRQGGCSGSADWKLKLSPEDGRIQVEYEVDSNVSGQTWKIRITKNGRQIFKGTRQTHGASGSFTVRAVTSNPAGSDAFRARAVNGSQTCVGTAAF